MLPLGNRLIKRKDFELVHRSGRFFSFGDVFLKIKTNNLSETRIGISIGLKFSKKAVKRNSVKRKLRVLIKELLPKVKTGFDVIVMVKKNVEKFKNNQKIACDLAQAFKKAGLI